MKKISLVSVALIIFFLSGCAGNVFSQSPPDKAEIKNVILFIADGMGDNTINAAKKLSGKEFAMEAFPVKGHLRTACADNEITDSAAGATALACAVKTNIGFIAVSAQDSSKKLMSVSHVMKNAGKSVGIVTTDQTSGATPAGFTANSASRANEQEISLGELSCGFDLIWGGKSESITAESCDRYGFTYVETRTALEGLSKEQRSFAQFCFDDLKNVTDNYDTPRLDEMTQKAIELLSTNEDGFFLMVEGACIDKFSHENDFDGMTLSLCQLDRAISKAIDFAKENENTLIIVTADHETGGISFNSEKDEYYYTTTWHTGEDVPFFVSRDDTSFYDAQTLENTQLAIRMLESVNIQDDSFPTQ